MKRHCDYCGKEYETDNITKHRKNVCSHGCSDMYNKWNKTPNVSCCICGIEFYVKPSRLKRLKHTSLHNTLREQKRDEITGRWSR